MFIVNPSAQTAVSLRAFGGVHTLPPKHSFGPLTESEVNQIGYKLANGLQVKEHAIDDLLIIDPQEFLTALRKKSVNKSPENMTVEEAQAEASRRQAEVASRTRDTISSQVSELNQDLDASRRQVLDLTGQLDEKSRAFTSSQERLADLTTQHATLKDNFDVATTELTAAKAEIIELKAKIAEVQEAKKSK